MEPAKAGGSGAGGRDDQSARARRSRVTQAGAICVDADRVRRNCFNKIMSVSEGESFLGGGSG